MLKITLGVFFLTLLWHYSESGLAATWDSCGCYWASWDAWSQCSESCGGGYRYRSRSVWGHDTPECEGFESCATSDMGNEYDHACNAVCDHGTYSSGRCRCPTGWYGRCCSSQKTCGQPGSIRNGYIQGPSYVYNSVITYRCNTHYTLTGGSATRRCQLNSIWSGSTPRCAFINSCRSNPCQNQGTCQNIIDSYKCVCSRSFTGVHCETDIQPPVMSGCHSNKEKWTSELMTHLNWTAPSFYDPVRKPINISSNYPTDSYEFPWGDFVVHYVALKPSNGMRTTCVFSWKIRPYPCKPLSVPQNGALVCNGWSKDYGQFCLVFCGPQYSLDIQSSHRQWHVCGASGKWIPQERLPNCTGTFMTSKTDDDRFRFTNCSSSGEIRKMQDTYITILQTSGYGSFCRKFQDLCRPENVDVTCD